MQAWWGNAASAEAEITLAMAARPRCCRIIELRRHADRLRARGRDRPVGRGAARRAAAGHLGRRPVHRLGSSIAAAASAAPRWPCSSEEVFATTLAVACCGRRVDQERGCRAGLRAGGLPLAADLARPAARPLLADAEGAAEPAARSLSWPAATSSRDTVSVALAGDLLERGLDPAEPIALPGEPGVHAAHRGADAHRA